MTPLEVALNSWFAFHAKLGVDIEAYLLPPATESQITAVEAKIGFRLPEDLRELYKIANGQWNMFDDDTSLIDVAADQRWAPLFGNHDFMPLDKALQRYESYLEMYTSDKDFNSKYYQANPDLHYEPVVWEVREGDSVDEAGWNPNWFAFAGSSSDSYSVDMAPPLEGAPGQVVLHGADEYVLQVVGNSVTDLIEQALVHLSADEEHRYQYTDRDGSYRGSLFFDMDWRAQLHVPQTQPDEPPAYTDWLDEQDRLQEIQREQLNTWLKGRGVSDEERNGIVQWLDLRLMESNNGVPPVEILMQMQMLAGSQGKMPDIGHMAEQVTELLTSAGSDNLVQGYATNLAAAYMTGDSMAKGMGVSMPVTDLINLYHQFKYESGDWTQADFNKAEALLVELQRLPIESESGFGMHMVGNVLSICVGNFDEVTYKDDETCYEIDLSLL